MTWVWDNSAQKGGSLLVLLAFADWASDDGTSIFPSVSAAAKKARLSERQVQRIINDLIAEGELRLIGKRVPDSGRADLATWEYAIPLKRGDILSGVTSERGDIHDKNGVTPMSPDPLERDPLDKRDPRDALESWFETEFIPAYPTHRQVQKVTAERELRKIKPDADERMAIMAVLEAWKESYDWTHDSAEYVPGMAKFFKDGLYQRSPAPRNPTPPTNGHAPRLSGGMANLQRNFERELEREANRGDQDTGQGQGDLVPAANGRRYDR